MVWSLYNHHAKANADWYRAINDTPGRVGPPCPKPPADIRQYYREWFEGDGYPFWSLWENVRGWWEVRHLPNVMLLHYARLKQDLAGEIRRIADFLDIDIDEARFPAIVEHAGFDYMKKNASKSTPLAGAFWDGGAETFIYKGTNGRWRDVLSEADVRAYEERALAELGTNCAAWLAGEPTF